VILRARPTSSSSSTPAALSSAISVTYLRNFYLGYSTWLDCPPTSTFTCEALRAGVGTARIRPDLIFESPPGKAVYVADTKYKITADGYARDTDYYQILAYTRALDVPAGMLIYCQRDGGAPPTAITVGAYHTRLDTSALTLSGTPPDIERRLAELANLIGKETRS
jgi:hypothetical protein